MYLGYLDKLIRGQLHESFGFLRKEKKIGYIISVKKILMDNVFGSKEDLQKLLRGSGITSRSNKCKNVRIVTHG